MNYELRLGVDSTEIFISKNQAPSFLNYGIVMSGITHINDEYFLSRQKSKFHIILYTVSGEGLLHVQDNQSLSEYRLKAGELLVLPKGQSFNYQLSNEKWHFIWFMINEHARWDFLTTPLVNTINEGHRLKPMLRLLNDEHHDKLKPVLVTEIHRIISQGVTNGTLTAKSNIKQSFKIRQLFEEVSEQLHYPWTATQLAKRMHCAVPSLHRYCQKEFSISPMQYVIQLRINRAKVLLKETNWTLDAIAAQLGYASGLSFSKVFKQKEGVSPSYYRE